MPSNIGFIIFEAYRVMVDTSEINNNERNCTSDNGFQRLKSLKGDPKLAYILHKLLCKSWSESPPGHTDY